MRMVALYIIVILSVDSAFTMIYKSLHRYIEVWVVYFGTSHPTSAAVQTMRLCRDLPELVVRRQLHREITLEEL